MHTMQRHCPGRTGVIFKPCKGVEGEGVAEGTEGTPERVDPFSADDGGESGAEREGERWTEVLVGPESSLASAKAWGSQEPYSLQQLNS